MALDLSALVAEAEVDDSANAAVPRQKRSWLGM
jgi:hypothetical protein